MNAKRQEGLALITMLVLMALLMALLTVHFSMTWIELSTTQSSMNSFVGFYAAEAGLNVRADEVRQKFAGYSQPSGTSPDTSNGAQPCAGSNQGSSDFACTNYAFQNRDVVTWVEETALSTNPIIIPRGETYKNLRGHEYHYIVYSNAMSVKGLPEAVLEMHFKSRVVPLFQFAAFYDKDLEILLGPDLLLEGPVHTNGDLYVGSDSTLDIMGQVTVAGNLYHGRKDANTCMSGDVQVADPDDQTAIPSCSGSRKLVTAAEVGAWNGMINPDVTPLTLPPATVLDPTSGQPYWDNADLRVVLDINGAPAIEVRQADGTTNAADSATLNACGVIGSSDTLYDNRESAWIDMLDVDIQGLLNCLHASNLMGYDIDDTTNDGLVFHFSVDGPNSATINNYGIRLTNADELTSNSVSAPDIAGMTIASDQAIYIQGHYNAVNKKPTAILADSLNVLSGDWDDANSDDDLDNRDAGDTTINAAIMAGTDTTGGFEGATGQDIGGFGGGMDNLMRLHEDWDGVALTYRGSFVSLRTPDHVGGAWCYGDPCYRSPDRDWNFDLDFEDPLLLPPLSPMFIFLRQELFVRRFEI